MPKVTPCLPFWRDKRGTRAVRGPAHARKQLVREPGGPASICDAPGSAADRAHREACGRTTTSHGHGKSDCRVVPEKLPNKAAEGSSCGGGKAVAARLQSFGLTLHPNKTRLIEFGRFARDNARRRGQGKPQTFDFLGFTHWCGKTSNGKFMAMRLTCAKRLRAVVYGHARYFGVPNNGAWIIAFRFQVARLWRRTLCRRSQTHHLPWRRLHRLIDHWLPPPRVCHPYPNQRLIITTRGRSRMRQSCTYASVEGVPGYWHS